MLRILPAGDQALSVEFGDQVSEAVSRRVIAFSCQLEADPMPGIVEVVPTYRSLLVMYDPAVRRGAELANDLRARLSSVKATAAATRRFSVPVCYEGEAALDVAWLAEMKKLDPEALIALHGGAEYRVYMIGFMPGFAYLGGLPEALFTPRLDVPRPLVAAGSVGVGGQQACITSFAGPSGWRYLGRTPVRLFDIRRREASLLAPGDRVTFNRIGPDEADALDRRAAAGEALVEPCYA
ncbi:5-oxoprolinase subunit PxpB [Martelella alba]|uniref:5-oxoprolinase subunit PxpB n=1 Tax=Martelella alba TaxID=2590451 RepID=A0A506U9E3_9HYPH|nr:5-oxoprolinase subunit PxpB [Martelella alba]TPW29701.1 5-oxoprolinase subunit PxpB [Martelella alba]